MKNPNFPRQAISDEVRARLELERQRVASHAVIVFLIYCTALCVLAFFTARASIARAVEVYPVVKYSHLSDATQAGRNEIGADYIGVGGGIAFGRGLTVEGTLGQKWLNCTGSKACGRTNGAQFEFTWRGKRRE